MSAQLPIRPLGRVCAKCGGDDWYRLKSGKDICAQCKRARGKTADKRKRLAKGQGVHGQCDACHLETRLNKDHNHHTGALRGNLCRGCNLAIGHACESIPTLYALISYLMEWEGK